VTSVIAAVLAAAAVWYVLAPLWRGAASDRSASAERARLEEERETALRALRDLALDHATGKMSDADYEALRVEQEAAAIDALRRLDAMEAPASGARPPV
jgi:cytochrome c-type biogenesis protein CcmI